MSTLPDIQELGPLFVSQRGRAAVRFLTRIRLEEPELWAEIVEFHERISGSAVSPIPVDSRESGQQALPEERIPGGR